MQYDTQGIALQEGCTCLFQFPLFHLPFFHFYALGAYRIVVLDYSAEYEYFCELFGRIRIQIVLPAEHFDAAPAVLIFTTYLCPSLITAMPACCL